MPVPVYSAVVVPMFPWWCWCWCYSIDGDGCTDRDGALVSCERIFSLRNGSVTRACEYFVFRLFDEAPSYNGWRAVLFCVQYSMLKLKVARAGSKEKTTEIMCVCLCVCAIDASRRNLGTHFLALGSLDLPCCRRYMAVGRWKNTRAPV